MRSNGFYFSTDNRKAERLLSFVLAQSPRVSTIHFKHINNKGLRLIASDCGPSLQILRAGVDKNALRALLSVCKRCPNLTVLDHNNFMCDVRHMGDPDELVLTALHCCPQIRVLPTAYLALTDVAMNALTSLHTLTELKLKRYDSDDSEAVQRVIKANPHLTCISLDGHYIDAALVSCIARSSGKLRCVELRKDPFTVGDPDDINTAFGSALLELFGGCAHLEEFTLHQALELTHASLRALFQYCPKLTNLDIYINSTAAADLADEPVLNAPFPTLTRLSVQGGGLADRALRDIFTYCANLREVQLRNSNQATDNNVQLLLCHCTHLSTFTLWGCTGMSPDGVLYVASHCPSLKVLILGSMPVNDEVLIALSQHCLNLRMLLLQSCNSGPITEVGVRALAEGCPGLTHLSILGNIAKPLTPTLELMMQEQLYPHVEFRFYESTTSVLPLIALGV